jgi:ribosomal protein L11 methyltransferase
MSVLDLGTGTGILAIAAAKLGAAHVLAVDIDRESVRIARENAVANQVAETIAVEEGSLDMVLAAGDLKPASLVIANILAHVIVRFLEQGLGRTIAPGGLLILSGILRTQTPEIYAALQAHGLERLAQEQVDEWVCVIARRPAV